MRIDVVIDNNNKSTLIITNNRSVDKSGVNLSTIKPAVFAVQHSTVSHKHFVGQEQGHARPGKKLHLFLN